MMGAVSSSQTPVTIYKSTLHHVPKGLNLCEHHCQNLHLASSDEKFWKCMITIFSNKPHTLTFSGWDDGMQLAVFTCSCSPAVYCCAGWYINSCTSPFGRSEFLPKMTPPCAVSGGSTTNVSHETGFILTCSPATHRDKNMTCMKKLLTSERRDTSDIKTLKGQILFCNKQRLVFLLTLNSSVRLQ